MQFLSEPASLLVTEVKWDSVFPNFHFNGDTFVGEFNNFGTSEKPIVITLSDLFHPVKPFIFNCHVKFRNPDFIGNQKNPQNDEVSLFRPEEEEYIRPSDYHSIGIRSNGRVYIPKDKAHRFLGEWWLNNVWPEIKDIPGVTKYSAFHRFNGIEMEKYVPGWTSNWHYFSRDVCEIMEF